MGGSRGHIALMQVIGFHPHAQQAFVQPLHRLPVVVDSPQQNGLIHQRQPGIQEAGTSLRSPRCQFRRMGEMEAQP